MKIAYLAYPFKNSLLKLGPGPFRRVTLLSHCDKSRWDRGCNDRNNGKLQPESQVLVHIFLFVYPP